MSIPNLPTNFKDDILNTSVNSKRKYQMINNPDETVSFEDETDYTQEGSDFGAGQINATNDAINKIYSERILSLEEVALVTEPGFFVDAMVVSELIGELEDTGWLEIIGTPLAVNIKAPDAGTPVKYRKKNGIVFVSGTFGIVNAPTSGNYTLFTLPEECLPDFSGYYYVTNTATGARMSRYLINASGVHLEWVRSIIDGSQSTGAITWAGIDFSFPAKA